jgi:hypothetical protein
MSLVDLISKSLYTFSLQYLVSVEHLDMQMFMLYEV